MVLPSTSPMKTRKIIGSPDFAANRMKRLPTSRGSPHTPQAAIPPAPAAAARDTSGAAGRKPESVRRNSRSLAGSTPLLLPDPSCAPTSARRGHDLYSPDGYQLVRGQRRELKPIQQLRFLFVWFGTRT